MLNEFSTHVVAARLKRSANTTLYIVEMKMPLYFQFEWHQVIVSHDFENVEENLNIVLNIRL
jgi:hypothetical protein